MRIFQSLETSAAGPANRAAAWAVAALVFAVAVVLFWPATAYDFVNFDDDVYVSGNPVVKQGLTPVSVRWAFTTVHENYWIPLTWLSYMADSQFLGAGPRGYHATNLLLHALNGSLFFLVFLRLTGAAAPSLLAALLFAVHPLRVESVAWITERKDLVSTLFWLLGIGAYARYARRPGWARMAAVTLCMLAGLMAKPMVVTFPITLLLLDVWPLRRLEAGTVEAGRLISEKWPLFVLSAVFAFLTWHNQSAMGSVEGLHAFPLSARLLIPWTNLLFYIEKAVWPVGLRVVYPDTQVVVLPRLVLALAVGIGLTVVAVRARSACPHLLFGWLWFVATLLPVIGIVRVGLVYLADRFTYVPLAGLMVAFSWEIHRRLGRLRVFPLLAALGLLSLAAVTRHILPAWTDSFALFERVLRFEESAIAYNNLGQAEESQGRLDEALADYRHAVALRPWHADAWANAGNVLRKQGHYEEAVKAFNRALQLQYESGRAKTQNLLGIAYLAWGRFPEAVACFEQSLRRLPHLTDTRFNLAVALLRSQRPDDALPHLIEVSRMDPRDAQTRFLAAQVLVQRGAAADALPYFEIACRLAPGNADYRAGLASALLALGHRYEGIAQYRQAIAASPSHLESLNNLAWTLATGPDVTGAEAAEAVALAARALAVRGPSAPLLDTSAAACAALGDFTQAVARIGQAVELCGDADPLRERLNRRIESYRNGRRLVEAGPSRASPQR